MKSIIKVAVTTILFVLYSGSLHADTDKESWKKEKGRMGEHFKEMDTNKDGVVSKAEFDIAHDKHFAEMDVNNDDKLTHEEMRAGHKKARKKRRLSPFDKADVNKDGMLDREEVASVPRLKHGFYEIDTSKDNKVSRAELEAALRSARRGRY